MTREWRIVILGLAPMLLIPATIFYSIYSKIERDKKIESIEVIRHVFEFPNKEKITYIVEEELKHD